MAHMKHIKSAPIVRGSIERASAFENSYPERFEISVVLIMAFLRFATVQKILDEGFISNGFRIRKNKIIERKYN
jgi:hypothetical protein